MILQIATSLSFLATNVASAQEPITEREFRSIEHMRAAALLQIGFAAWTARLDLEENVIEDGLFSEKREHLQTFVIGQLIKAALQPDADFGFLRRSSFYGSFEVIESGRGRPGRDALLKLILAEFGLPNAEPPSWRLHRDFERMIKVPDTAFDHFPRVATDTSALVRKPDAIAVIHVMLNGERLLPHLGRVYRALDQINRLPRSPLTRVALEVLLEVEAHATIRLFRNDQAPAHAKFILANELGLSLRDRGVDPVAWRVRFEQWLRGQSRVWTTEEVADPRAARDACESALASLKRIIGAKLRARRDKIFGR